MIHASAPARVDLAGGTLDIWPLCHLLSRPAVTVNVAIDRRAEAWVEEREDGWVEIHSEDRRESVRVPAARLGHDRLPIATRLVAWFGAGRGLSIRMRSAVPPGSGLGGSSTLAVALAAALAELRGRRFAGDAFREFVQTVETTIVRTPTGYQDYVPAIHGGVNAITASIDGIHVEPVEGALEFLSRHLVLLDTGVEHRSGLNNWEVVKRFIDGDRGTVDALEAIAACAARMREALLAQDLEAVAAALDEEWTLRRRLSPLVTNDAVEAAVAAAHDGGALAAKVCGAGGGGCLAALVPDAATFDAPGLLAAHPDPDGLRVV